MELMVEEMGALTIDVCNECAIIAMYHCDLKRIVIHSLSVLACLQNLTYC